METHHCDVFDTKLLYIALGPSIPFHKAERGNKGTLAVLQTMFEHSCSTVVQLEMTSPISNKPLLQGCAKPHETSHTAQITRLYD